MSGNHLKLEIPDEILDNKKETTPNLEEERKLRKSAKLWEILVNVCALLNSNGGKLELYPATAGKAINQDIVVKLAEEISRHLVFNASTIVKIFKIDRSQGTVAGSITFEIVDSPELVTLKYNLFLPTDTQVIPVRPVEYRSRQQILNIIERKPCEFNEVPEDDVHFIAGQPCGLEESQTVQFKNIEMRGRNGTTFVHRVIANHFRRHVTAFANHRGGRIYYGIKDDGIVAGEKLNDVQDVKTQIEKEIDTMDHKVQSKDSLSNGTSDPSGIRYNIAFKPVKKDASSDEILQSTFVMIVSISPFPGGVFIEEPESYCIEEKKVVKIEFSDWLAHFKMGRLPWSITVTPHTDLSNRVHWSSPQRRRDYLLFTIGLVQSRNDNDVKEFNRLEKLAESELFQGTDAPLIVLMEKVAVHYKNHQFEVADSLLQSKIPPALERSPDQEFHETKALYLKSRIKRAQGDYEESYEVAKDCLRSMARLPAEFITVWCYMQLAIMGNILGARENDPAEFLQARRWLDLALRDACALEEFPSGLYDVQQKLCIYRAMTLLKCSLTGEIADLAVTPEEVDAAGNELTNVCKSDMKGNQISLYREIQYLFGRCCVFLRHSEHTKSMLESHEKLKRAGRLAGQAKNLAGDFKDMVRYATLFQKIVNERIHTVLANCEVITT